jgi:putative FmdB family regulatory protein
MPLYEFTCKKCGHNFEELYSLAEVESGSINCPACKSKRVDKGFSAFATGSESSGGGLSGGGCGSGGFT